MTLAGAPDWQTQQASAITPVGTLAVNTSTSQSLDVTAGILPYHAALQIYWIASLASVGEAVQVGVNATLNSASFLPSTLIGDGDMTICSVPGRYVTDNAGNTLTVTAAVPSGGAKPLQGTLLVFAISDLAVVQTKTSASLVGFGNTATASCPTLSTVTLLAAPISGQYYRLKMVALLGPSTAPTANASVAINPLTFLGSLLPLRADGTGHQAVQLPLDLQWSDGLQIANNTNGTYTGYVAYETWNG